MINAVKGFNIYNSAIDNNQKVNKCDSNANYKGDTQNPSFKSDKFINRIGVFGSIIFAIIALCCSDDGYWPVASIGSGACLVLAGKK